MISALFVDAHAADQNQKMQNMGCSNLSADEQNFASQLTDPNRKIFCGQFTADQRKEAMAAACSGKTNCGTDRKAGKMILSPDDAVQQVMAGHRNP